MAIGTTAAIMMGVSAASSAGSSIHGARSASKQNERALEAQQTSEQQALAFERDKFNQEMAYQRQLDQRKAMDQELAYQQFQAVNQPYRDVSNQALAAAMGRMGVPVDVNALNRPMRTLGQMQQLAGQQRPLGPGYQQGQRPQQSPFYGQTQAPPAGGAAGARPPAMRRPPMPPPGQGGASPMGYRRPGGGPVPPQAMGRPGQGGFGTVGDMRRMAEMTARLGSRY